MGSGSIGGPFSPVTSPTELWYPVSSYKHNSSSQTRILLLSVLAITRCVSCVIVYPSLLQTKEWMQFCLTEPRTSRTTTFTPADCWHWGTYKGCVCGCEWCVYGCGCVCGCSSVFMGVCVCVCRLVSVLNMRSLAMYKSTPTLLAEHCWIQPYSSE